MKARILITILLICLLYASTVNASAKQELNLDVTGPSMPSPQVDEYGYSFEQVPFDFIEASDHLEFYGDDSMTVLQLPFAFPFYGHTYTEAHLITNGFLTFIPLDDEVDNFLDRYGLPDLNQPHAGIYVFWDDLVVRPGYGSFHTELLGTAPDRRFVIEWRGVAFFTPVWGLPQEEGLISEELVNFEVVLYEDGDILMQYTSIDDIARMQGESATIGIENETSTIGLQYSHNQAVLRDGLAVLYNAPPYGFVEGLMTDAVSGTPLEGVQVQALNANAMTTTAADGRYRLLLREGTYTLQASLDGYEVQQAEVLVLDRQTTVQDFPLRAPRAQVSPETLEFTVPVGQTQSTPLVLSNVGLADLVFRIDQRYLPAEAGAEALSPGAHIASVTAPLDGPVLVFMDERPRGSEATLQLLDANNIAFDIANSSQMSTIDLFLYEVVFLSSDQPVTFYSSYSANVRRFEDYVRYGGFLWIGGGSWGYDAGEFTGGHMPGGATVGGFDFEQYNEVLDPAHPIMQGVPNPFQGSVTSLTYFENLPPGTNIIARGQESGLPTLFEHDFGDGKVLAFAQPVEYGFFYAEDTGRLLENSIPYAYSFEPQFDNPWLSMDIMTGTISPGSSQTIMLNVNAAGLEPGVYEARIIIFTNDIHNPILQIPITLIITPVTYTEAVNVGGPAYTDIAGTVWAADQMYEPGSWGYVGKSKTVVSKRPISGTDDDLLYQSQRQNMQEYRFDGLASGVYQVDLYFAELWKRRPGTHRFDVLLEDTVALPAHDIAADVSSFAVDHHTFFVEVNDGTLNIGFRSYPGRGRPVLNALQVTYRPDL